MGTRSHIGPALLASMASKGAVASGADYDQAVRRRNVPSGASIVGEVKIPEIDKKKTQAKKVRMCNPSRCVACVLPPPSGEAPGQRNQANIPRTERNIILANPR